ncbi:60S ribosomal protein L12 [Artemisia annua]|uniref:60S ribosomal protein L12 n=1 Tax=Artemisia annua TaxID=35608 RepID=A0A2U1M7F9_ARTAN|nr:60S ribosomal protein L12 [Artemisia annua]PWA89885.1 60S ribosomal protein L12 [Artemisia annua]
MPPKFDPSQAVEVYIRVTGGDQAVDGLTHLKLTLQNRLVKVSVVPPGVALVIKALKELERDGQKVNNISLDAVFEIARVVQTRTMTKDYKRGLFNMILVAIDVF